MYIHTDTSPFWSFTHLKAILTQNIQTTFFIQITFVLKVTKHKSLYIQLSFNQNQFYQNQFFPPHNQTHAKCSFYRKI